MIAVKFKSENLIAVKFESKICHQGFQIKPSIEMIEKWKLILMLSFYSLVGAECIQPVSNCNSSVNYFPNIPDFLYAKTVARVESKNTWIAIELEYGDPKVRQSYSLVRWYDLNYSP